MSRRYDSRTTMFSPEGRLFQVEYAMEAISHAGTCLGILASDGVVIAAEKKVVSSLLETDKSTEKLYIINDNIVCAVAGLTSDANILVNSARQYAQSYLMNYGTDIPIESLVKRLSDSKQAYTQFGGLRPYGVSILYAGYDDSHGFQLYHSDPSGNYGGWKATCIGANFSSAQSVLKQEYKEELNIDQALEMTIKVLSKTMDTANLTEETLDGKPKYQIYSPSEIKELLELYKDALETEKIEA
ncbi:proteasome subunit alpha type-4 [Neoconidiobolus thromboides FSU 785]|nr:proteasome subunit alpha type-4 [Neoconidiobolus thromboides FSU 785]